MVSTDDLHLSLADTVRDLVALDKEIGANEAVPSEQRARLADITNRLKEALAGPDLAPAAAPDSREAGPIGSGARPKHPSVDVKLADISSDPHAILRRASYAMSDADIDDREIDKFKEELKASRDPVAVTKSWVTVTDL